VTFVWITTLGILRWPLLAACALSASWARRRRRRVVVVVAVAVVVLLDMAVEASDRVGPDADAGGGATLTVLTHNVLFDGGDAEATIAAIRAADPDVAFLQEVSVRRASVLAAALEERFPHRLEALSAGRGHGLVTLSKQPLTPIESWASGRGNVVGQCLEVAGVAACNLHLTSPSVAFDNPHRFVPVLLHNARFRWNQWETIEETALAHGALIMIGDVNTMVVEPLFRRLRRRWVDAWRAVHPFASGATYPHGSHGPPNKFARPGLPFVRPDYVLLDPSVRPVRADTVAAGGSDHRPLIVELELPPR